MFKKSTSDGDVMETSHMMRCIFMALKENLDPSKKQTMDELRKFYRLWAKFAN